MLEKLFEAIDDKILTPELKSEMEASYNEAVELKATELSEAKIQELEEKAEQFKAELEAKNEESQKELLESVDSYLNRVVDNFLSESKEKLDESLKAEKADMIIEAFDAMIVAGSVDVAKIVEAKEESMVESALESKTAEFDKLVEENIAKDKEINDLLKKGVIAEMKEGLSIVEAGKFEKLAEIVEFSRDDKYVSKLETIKESVKGADKVEKLDEKTEEVNTPSWKKFV